MEKIQRVKTLIKTIDILNDKYSLDKEDWKTEQEFIDGKIINTIYCNGYTVEYPNEDVNEYEEILDNLIDCLFLEINKKIEDYEKDTKEKSKL